MKLRIKNDSIRLRLTQTEVRRFAERGRVDGTTTFGPETTLRYVLQSAPEATDLLAALEENCLTVYVPDALAAEWTSTDRVGMQARRDTEAGIQEILVEKDFECLHKEDRNRDADAFPHPMAEQGPRA